MEFPEGFWGFLRVSESSPGFLGIPGGVRRFPRVSMYSWRFLWIRGGFWGFGGGAEDSSGFPKILVGFREFLRVSEDT